MGATVTTLLNAVNDELGLARPNGYVGGADIQVRQMVALLHKVGDFLVQECEWQELVKQGTVNTVNGVASYALPTDFAQFVDETFWNTTARNMVTPREQEDWARTEGSGVAIGPYYVQQLRANSIYLQPTPTAVQTLNYYYVGTNWIALAAGGTATRAASDSDTVIWGDDRLLIAGVKASWLRSKRLSYDEEADEFRRRLNSAKAGNRGVATVNINPSGAGGAGRFGFIVPIGSWPL